MKRQLTAVLAIGVMAAGCTTSQVQKIQSASANFQASVASINADIAAIAPNVYTACADIQKYAGLIIPFIPTNGKAPQYVAAANGAINAYCQNVPTDIQTAAVATAAAAKAALNGYNQVKAGS